ncbi:Zinc finger HIT domain-containing protein 2 [Linderina macrospora]|uniref:Zinc finger HIT domain-containing protein 2 n=1 Tax=Linderina macrospora TaxID=4868 RepID=A0ACC1J5T1_9FUNG|nr:Zinc finger HIT domain-containing protein 2 [Linderina macrospora]
MDQKHDGKGCQICGKPRAKYNCPKCHIAYCSLACYRDQKHSECTESFYQAQVADELKARQADDTVKKEMYELLQRYQQGTLEDADGDEVEDEIEDIADRMEGLDLENASMDDIWKRMTEEEQKEFLKLLDRGELEQVLQAWVPWWQASDKAGVTEVGGDQSSNTGSVPQISEHGVPVQMLAKKVHPSVLYQLAQIALAYVYMMRHLNGDPRGKNTVDAFQDLISVSPLLASKEADVYSNAHEALIVGLCNIDEGMPCDRKCALLDDMLSLYLGSKYIAAMLSDTHELLTMLLAMPASDRGSLKKAHVVRAERRVFFLLCVALQMSTGTEPWEFMAAEISMLQRRFRSEDATRAQKTDGDKAETGGKVPSISVIE